MDTAAFVVWLGGIGLLDRGQRAEAFRELALAEADDPIEADAVGAAVPLCGLPEDLQPADRDAVGRLASPGSLA